VLQDRQRPYFRWSPELEALFLNAVAQLGLWDAKGTSVCNLMKVEGLTREQVSTHLGHYRAKLKRQAGLPSSAKLTLGNMLKMQAAQQVGGWKVGVEHRGLGQHGRRQGAPPQMALLAAFCRAWADGA
jgi:SHAQKYF class myb-like DNA-binding protein